MIYLSTGRWVPSLDVSSTQWCSTKVKQEEINFINLGAVITALTE